MVRRFRIKSAMSRKKLAKKYNCSRCKKKVRSSSYLVTLPEVRKGGKKIRICSQCALEAIDNIEKTKKVLEQKNKDV